MNNSVFGKTMENIQLVTDKKKALKLAAHPNINRFFKFST